MRDPYARYEGGVINMVDQQEKQWSENCCPRSSSLSGSRRNGVVSTSKFHVPSIWQKRASIRELAKDPTRQERQELSTERIAKVKKKLCTFSSVQPTERTLRWEGRRPRMIVDTGSPVSCPQEPVKEAAQVVACSTEKPTASFIFPGTVAGPWQSGY
ncbi:hypothetical protein MTO96_009542 [Rhipicephalus appendiculatus]